MDIFDALNLLGGLCLFLFGMTVMGQALERRAGSGLRALLGKLTSSPVAGLLTGLGVTAVIQSSSATTVMVVGFVNSGLITLRQSIGVIMGANIGTTVTAWILSLAGIESSSFLIRMLKPSSFSPILALCGIILYMFCKSDKKKDTGTIMLGFAVLMYGMETMSSAVSGLKDVPAFQQLFLAFTNPLLGVLAGAVLTAIIQSSSASVGILQALAATGQVTYGAAIPIIMGQNIGTCITAILSSIGTNKNARRAALVHLSFNVIGTAVWLSVFCIVRAIFMPAILGEAASLLGIAIIHSIFNILCTILMLPMGGLLEKLVCRLVPDSDEPQKEAELDERLLATPAIALERCASLMDDMASCAVEALGESIDAIGSLTPELAESVRACEAKTDHYEDRLGAYLVKLSEKQTSAADSRVSAAYLKLIGDFERIADHGVNILESAEELHDKGLTLSESARKDLSVLTDAVREVTSLTYKAFVENNLDAASRVEPLVRVISDLKEELRTRHITRLQRGECSIDAGFSWSDILTALERVGEHCSNIAGCVLDTANSEWSPHADSREPRRNSDEFKQEFKEYRRKYVLA